MRTLEFRLVTMSHGLGELPHKSNHHESQLTMNQHPRNGTASLCSMPMLVVHLRPSHAIRRRAGSHHESHPVRDRDREGCLYLENGIDKLLDCVNTRNCKCSRSYGKPEWPADRCQ